MLRLLIGIKRSIFRADDQRHKKADAAFAAKRPGILSKHKMTCAGCAYESKVGKSLDVHHRDDNHHNNDDDNLVPACHTCHPYQHVGEIVRRADVPGEGLGKSTLIAGIPELSARDCNLLQRALGVALHDEKEAPMAREIIKALATRAEWAKSEFGTFRPADFAGAMAALKPDEYEAREDAINDMRILFSETTLKKLGSQMQQDYPSMPLSSWPAVAEGASRREQR